jgi:hypothetical protein
MCVSYYIVAFEYLLNCFFIYLFIYVVYQNAIIIWDVTSCGLIEVYRRFG